ncbi:hypothetical protein FRC17_006374 [Serendipita sp. 399]|nr:hypothetical protein FRC17_006374 [Serendipita sp. 399]
MPPRKKLISKSTTTKPRSQTTNRQRAASRRIIDAESSFQAKGRGPSQKGMVRVTRHASREPETSDYLSKGPVKLAQMDFGDTVDDENARLSPTSEDAVEDAVLKANSGPRCKTKHVSTRICHNTINAQESDKEGEDGDETFNIDAILDEEDVEDDDDIDDDTDSVVIPPKSVASSTGNGMISSRGRGRPRKETTTVPSDLKIIFMITVNGVVETFGFQVYLSIYDLHDHVAELVKKRPNDLDLLWTSVWGKRSEAFRLSTAQHWNALIDHVQSNLHRKKTVPYHIILQDGINKPKAGAVNKSTASASNGNEKDTELIQAEEKATDALARLQEHWNCKTHGYECFIIKTRAYEPKVAYKSHQRIPPTVLLRWADDCVSGRAGLDTMPEKLLSELLGIEPTSDDESGVLKLPETKPRGRTGPNPSSSVAANIETQSLTSSSVSLTTNSSVVQPPQSAASAMIWPPPPPQSYTFPLPPNYPYPTPGYPFYGFPPASPTRLAGKGPRLVDWLADLDQDAESDEESYGDLLGSLKAAGIFRVKDILLWNAADLAGEINRPPGIAKRLISEAKAAVRG